MSKLINKKEQMDMLNGSIVDKLLLFAIPLALTNILQQLFNAADVIVCGRWVGAMALAAVGANTQIVNLFVNAFTGLGVGINVMIANYIGAKKNDKISRVVQTAMTFGLVFGVLLLIVGQLLERRILLFLGTPLDILDEARKYLKILLIGIPFMVLYNFGAAILRSIGDTRRPLIILTISGVINVILNIYFVVVMNIGVAGVAIATVMSNVIACVVVIYLLTRENGDVHYDITKWMINIDALLKVLKVGVPCAIQGMVFSISNLCVQSAVNSLGTNTIAANAAAINFENYPYFLLSAFAQGVTTFMSQNLGALNYRRSRNILRISLGLALASSVLIAVFLNAGESVIIRFFTVDETVIAIAHKRIVIVSRLVWLEAIFECLGGALRAMRHPYLPPIMVIIGTVFFRIWWCTFMFPKFNTYEMVAIVYPISWIIIDVATLIAYAIISVKDGFFVKCRG